MYFIYSPQRSSDVRIDYYFEPSKQRIIITHRTGIEITNRVNGEYFTYFHEHSRKEYITNLSSTKIDVNETPNPFVIDCKTNDNHPHLKLLKPYGPEEEFDLSIRFPSWNRIDGDCSEHDINRKTSLNEFQKFNSLWVDQLSEIKCQIYNLLCLLVEEYKKINSTKSTPPSPISIRAIKTSIFQNAILYIEAVANFLSAVAVNIDNGLAGAPKKKIPLEQEDLKKLNETNGYIRLQDKLILSTECLNKLIGSSIKIDKSSHHWGRFKDFKKRRDNLTHIRVPINDGYRTPSMDNMTASVKITDGDIEKSVELLQWFNSTLNRVAESIGHDSLPNHYNFNDYIAVLMASLATSISIQSNNPP